MRILAIITMMCVFIATPVFSATSDFGKLVNNVKKSIVYIETFKKYRIPDLQENIGDISIREFVKPTGIGTGFVIKGNYIVTNYHVIKDANIIHIYFEHSRRPIIADIVGYDEISDIAVLSAHIPKTTSYLSWKNYNDVNVGDNVWAIGHPYGFRFSVSKGIISHKNRSLSNAWRRTLQSDVAINEGNSGGPLLDMDGKIIGINTALFSKNDAGSVGISMSLDSEISQYVINEIVTKGKVDRPSLGVILEYDSLESRIKINDIIEGSSASNSGLLINDLIIQINNKDIYSITDIVDIMRFMKPHSKITILVERNGDSKEINVVLDKLLR